MGMKRKHTYELYGDDIREIGRRLGDLRRKAGATQQKLATEMCCTQSRVSDTERGTNDPRLSTLIRYADALGLDLFIELRARR